MSERDDKSFYYCDHDLSAVLIRDWRPTASDAKEAIAALQPWQQMAIQGVRDALRHTPELAPGSGIQHAGWWL